VISYARRKVDLRESKPASCTVAIVGVELIVPSSGTLTLRLLDSEPPLLHDVGVSRPSLTAVSLSEVPDRLMERAISFSSLSISAHGKPGLFKGFFHALGLGLISKPSTAQSDSSPMQ
jgi:hypothetical protein